jgi:ABC-type transport system involved in multi-copper enzyme maturation permease subunit
MAVFTIAGLTLKEAVRRRTLIGALVMGLLVLGLSCLLILIHMRMQHLVDIHRWTVAWMAVQYPPAQSAIMSLCLSSIKCLGAIFAALLAGGAISGEIERGLLAVILPKPVPRWQILLGKWIGLNLIVMCSSLLWSVMIWASFTAQPHGEPVTPLLHAAPYLALFPLVVCTLTLALSTVAPRLFGTTIALTLGAFAWFDGIFNILANNYDVDALHVLADIAGMVVPQGYIGYWVERATEGLIIQPPRSIGLSPTFLVDFGKRYLHFAHLDAIYVALYIVGWLAAGMILFQRRDI